MPSFAKLNIWLLLDCVEEFVYTPDRLVLPFVLTREFVDHGNFDDQVFNDQQNGDWRLLVFKCKGERFLVSLTFLGEYQRFILYVLMPKSPEDAKKFKVQVTFEEKTSNKTEKLTYIKNVVSIEEMRMRQIHELPSSNCVVLSQLEAERFMTIEDNEEDDFQTVHLPIFIDDVIAT